MQWGRFVKYGGFRKVAITNGVFAAWNSKVFQDKLRIKKGEDLFHKVLFVAEKLKLSLGRVCYVR